MLVHKDGQINNVQLITGLRIAEMSQLQNCSVKCTKNGSYCENGGGGGGGGGQGRCERRSEAFVKIQFFLFFFWGGGGGGGGGSGWGRGGVRVDVN